MRFSVVVALAAAAWPVLAAERAAVERKGQDWILTTDRVRRVVTLEGGSLFTSGWQDLVSGRQLLREGDRCEELAGKGWELVRASDRKHADGSLEVNITLRSGGLEAVKTYVLYPGSSIVRERVQLSNTGGQALKIEEPRFLNTRVRLGGRDSVDFHWMTGGENRPGSWVLKTETLPVEKSRDFDSYDPFPGLANAKFGFRMGSATYAPWNALFDKNSRQGVFIGWDYFGHWASRFRAEPDGSIRVEFRVAGHRQTLAPGESLTTPEAFTGLFTEDLDNAGNECLDWQYRYMWDYTRQDWFPAIRMLGWWWNGTPWKDPGNTWVGGNGDQASAFRKVFRVADLMSQVGADVYHRDWGWWDRAGDWGSPDFKTMGEYLRKRGMGQLIYAFIYTVDMKSRVAREHPEWVEKQTLDMSKPEVVKYLNGVLDDFARRFGPFEWRNDSTPTVPRGGDDTPLLKQDQGLREILRTFLDRHPDCAFQGVNGGGNNAGYDYARYASTISFSDGAVGIIRNHWASLILPPDKTSDIPDVWQPDKFDKEIWRGLLTINFDMTGETWDPAKVEGLRELIDIYHYLGSQGVVGRWVRVYRPRVDGDDPTMYFERLSRDGLRGIIIPKRATAGPVTIRPKGLLAREVYEISFQESDRAEKRKGADLMESGIRVKKIAPGELIYLNLPYHPGSKRYQQAPSAAASARKILTSHMGYPGVELRWTPAKDARWISYYQVLRDGSAMNKVAKGTFYFDHSAGADLAAKYEIRTVNGGGLQSGPALARGTEGARAQILDDAASAFSFIGSWQQEQNLAPAYAGTLRRSNQKGASFEFPVEGAKFTWFTRLCHECGKAEIAIDGRRETVVDTYSADDIWGAGIYSKSFDAPGRHSVKITVTGEHGGPRGKDAIVYLDGVRIEP